MKANGKVELLSKVQKVNGCWECRGAMSKGGYIFFWFQNRQQYAHRVSWLLFRGPIPEGLCVCHHCDNPRCVRPDHLFLGTHQENILDRDLKQRTVKGENHPHTRLDSYKIIRIRELSKLGESPLSIARQFSVSRSCIYHILHGRVWEHVR